MRLIRVIYFYLLLSYYSCFAQADYVDSLRREANLSKVDTVRFNAFMSIGNYVQSDLADTAIFYHSKAETIAKEKKLFLQRGQALRAIGVDYYLKGLYDTALYFFSDALKLCDQINSTEKDTTKLAKANFLKSSVLGNIGSTHRAKADYAKSLEYYFKALAISEQLKNKRLQAFNLSNIGVVYEDINEFTKALTFYNRALVFNIELKNKRAQSINLTNIGLIYSEFADSLVRLKTNDALLQTYYNKALYYFNASQKIDEEMDNKYGQAANLLNIGNVYDSRGNIEKALEYYERGAVLSELVGDKLNLHSAINDIGVIYYQQKNYAKAEKYFLQAFEISQELGAFQKICFDHRNLSLLYQGKGDIDKAFKHYKRFIELRDSIGNEENTKKIIQQELKFNYDKKATADSVRAEGEKMVISAQLKQERTQRIALYGGIILVLLFAFFFYNRFKVTTKQKKIIELKEKETQKQNEVITTQKHLVEEKQKEIIESITYAKRLQEAILPPQEFVNAHLPNNFILYKPKDLVAGDFYWAEHIGDLFFIAAADSTGHGVPGALVSVVCSNALNRSVKEFNLKDTGKILDKTRELVLETFAKSTSEVKDGMDISLLCIDPKNRKIFWSGANNPIWYIHHNTNSDNSENKELFEIKADKQPIGKSDHEKPFTTHHIPYVENTTFYLFTDGFADQFGGPNGKKFKYKQLSELLLSVSSKPIKNQAKIIHAKFEAWKGNLEQVDDVCLIGLKI